MFDESFAKRSSPRRESGQFVWDNILRSPQVIDCTIIE